MHLRSDINYLPLLIVTIIIFTIFFLILLNSKTPVPAPPAPAPPAPPAPPQIGTVTQLEIVYGGSLYNYNVNQVAIITFTGSGTNLIISYTVYQGSIITITVYAGGLGYEVGQTFTIVPTLGVPGDCIIKITAVS